MLPLKSIASELGITTITLKNHCNRLFLPSWLAYALYGLEYVKKNQINLNEIFNTKEDLEKFRIEKLKGKPARGKRHEGMSRSELGLKLEFFGIYNFETGRKNVKNWYKYALYAVFLEQKGIITVKTDFSELEKFKDFDIQLYLLILYTILKNSFNFPLYIKNFLKGKELADQGVFDIETFKFSNLNLDELTGMSYRNFYYDSDKKWLPYNLNWFNYLKKEHGIVTKELLEQI